MMTAQQMEKLNWGEKSEEAEARSFGRVGGYASMTKKGQRGTELRKRDGPKRSHLTNREGRRGQAETTKRNKF